VGVVPQGAQDGPCSSEKAVLACGCGKLAEAGAQDETALHVARDQAVVLEGNGEAVRGRSGQPGGTDELRQGRWAGFKGAQYDCGLVKHADSARVVHRLILPSQSLRRKFVRRDCAQTSDMSRWNHARKSFCQSSLLLRAVNL